MTRLEELEMAVASLPEEDYRQFRRWFLDKDWQKWDKEVEEDAKGGKLDFLVNEAREAKDSGQLRDL